MALVCKSGFPTSDQLNSCYARRAWEDQGSVCTSLVVQNLYQTDIMKNIQKHLWIFYLLVADQGSYIDCISSTHIKIHYHTHTHTQWAISFEWKPTELVGLFLPVWTGYYSRLSPLTVMKRTVSYASMDLWKLLVASKSHSKAHKCFQLRMQSLLFITTAILHRSKSILHMYV